MNPEESRWEQRLHALLGIILGAVMVGLYMVTFSGL